MSIDNQALVHFRHFRHFSSLLTIFPSTLVVRALQIHHFLCKTNPISKNQMNVNTFIAKNYEQQAMNYEIKNEPKRTQFQKGQNERIFCYNKGLRKYFKLGKTNPIKTQSKPIFVQKCQNKPNFLSLILYFHEAVFCDIMGW